MSQCDRIHPPQSPLGKGGSHQKPRRSSYFVSVPWTCHPEVVHALADALIHDPKDDVREEAAESLAKMGAVDPFAHQALRRAAMIDRDGGVRREARKTLASLPARSLVDCPLCAPVPTTVNRPMPPGEVIVLGSVTIIETVPEPRLAIPPDDVPPPPPTPVPSPTRSSRATFPDAPSAVRPPSDAAIRRSSAKPVLPAPVDLPPLEGPSR